MGGCGGWNAVGVEAFGMRMCKKAEKGLGEMIEDEVVQKLIEGVGRRWDGCKIDGRGAKLKKGVGRR